MVQRSIIRRIHRCAAALALLALGAAPGGAAAQCAGVDLLARLRAEAPDAYARLRAAADARPDGRGRFWRVEKPGLAVSHLFGTFHATEPEVARPPAAVRAAIDAARVIYVEITPDEQAEMRAAIQADPRLIMETDGATLDDFLTEEQAALARRVLGAYGIPYESGSRLKPWFLQVLTAQPPCALAAMRAGGEVLDSVISGMAAARGAPLRGLEHWEDSLAGFMSQPRDEARESLLMSFAMADEAEDFRFTATRLYLAGDIMMIWEFGRLASREGGAARDPDALTDRFWREVVVRRNARFIDAAAADFARGGAFVAVGALHLGGAEGMIGKLRAAGYAVTRAAVE